MLDMSNPARRLAATTVAKSTTRGAVSTTMWTTILWWLLVGQLHWFDPADPASVTIIGGIAAILTGTFRALERRWPWFGVLLLSQERPAYTGELEALTEAAPGQAQERPAFTVSTQAADSTSTSASWTITPPVVEPVDDDTLEGH